jgi:cytidylate kinase
MISKYKNAQLVFIDGKTASRIKRVIKRDGKFVYEMRESGEIIDEERISLLKN